MANCEHQILFSATVIADSDLQLSCSPTIHSFFLSTTPCRSDLAWHKWCISNALARAGSRMCEASPMVSATRRSRPAPAVFALPATELIAADGKKKCGAPEAGRPTCGFLVERIRNRHVHFEQARRAISSSSRSTEPLKPLTAGSKEAEQARSRRGPPVGRGIGDLNRQRSNPFDRAPTPTSDGVFFLSYEKYNVAPPPTRIVKW